MNKAQLLKHLENLPDDAEILVMDNQTQSIDSALESVEYDRVGPSPNPFIILGFDRIPDPIEGDDQLESEE